MFKHRVITAIILVPLILAMIWFLPMPWFAILMGAVVAWAGWEWSGLLGIERLGIRILYFIAVIVMLGVSYYLPLRLVLIITSLVWLWVFAAIVCYQKNLSPLGFQYPIVKAITGVLVLVSCWLSINVLREDIGGPIWLLFGLFMIWMMDTGCYFSGKLWGKRPLLTRVSPNKTWEGFWGGLVITLLLSMIICLIVQVPFHRFLMITSLSLVTVLFAVIGDLFESMLKRQVGVKDSGIGLPGHGGILDRIDSVLAALPIFTLGSLLMSKFL